MSLVNDLRVSLRFMTWSDFETSDCSTWSGQFATKKRGKKNLDTDLCNELLTVVHVDTSIKSATLGRTKKQESIPQQGRPPVKVGGHRLAARKDAARRHHCAALVAGRLLLRQRLLMNDVLTAAVKTDQELAIVGAGRYLQMQWMLPGHSHVASPLNRAHTRAYHSCTDTQRSCYYIYCPAFTRPWIANYRKMRWTHFARHLDFRRDATVPNIGIYIYIYIQRAQREFLGFTTSVWLLYKL